MEKKSQSYKKYPFFLLIYLLAPMVKMTITTAFSMIMTRGLFLALEMLK